MNIVRTRGRHEGHGDVRPCDNIYEITYNSKPLELLH